MLLSVFVPKEKQELSISPVKRRELRLPSPGLTVYLAVPNPSVLLRQAAFRRDVLGRRPHKMKIPLAS